MKRYALIDLTSGGEISRHDTYEEAERKIQRILLDMHGQPIHDRSNLTIEDTQPHKSRRYGRG